MNAQGRKYRSLACIVGLGAIKFYQRFLSPLKGYQCAHRVYYGKSSCSSYAARCLTRNGFLPTLRLMKRRFKRCQRAASFMDREVHSRPKGRLISGNLYYDPCCGAAVGTVGLATGVASKNSPYKGCCDSSNNASPRGGYDPDYPTYD